MKLKDKIAFDVHPKFSEDFSTKSLDTIFTDKNFISSNVNGTLGLFAFVDRHKFILLGCLLLGAFVLQQGHQKSVYEELLQIDTLSMSSFSVL
ncbi:hypothetical protein [Limnohabitans sp. 2KL-51]|uniref:hypothetical protein n=1 Tax=Limnohabitans sp. 2KL-51 TaxID=1977911 RepID=UPI0011B24248|nr:hypothetical protein [Limnohabitans sp. 2KL-51]